MSTAILKKLDQETWKFVDRHEFFQKTGMIRDYLDLEHKLVSIPASSPTGHFESEQLNALLAFCQEDQEFHIISYKDNTYYNCPLTRADFYFLGDGGKNPKLAHHNSVTIAEALKVAKFYMR